ncbi:MAG TPA: alpha/beta hydrolase, partial [Burkholderiaceae bacterium]
AADWGAHALDAGPRGHLNSDSGLGDWPAGRQLLANLLTSG